MILGKSGENNRQKTSTTNPIGNGINGETTVPIQSTSAAIAKTVELPTIQTKRNSCHQILVGLEKRLTACEKFIGDPLAISEGLAIGKEESGLTSLDSRQKEWIKDIEFSISDKTPLFTRIECIRKLTDQIFHGGPSELEKKRKNTQENCNRNL